MKKQDYDTLVIGHVSLDNEIDYQDNLIQVIGGAVIYSSASAYASGYRVGLVTKIAQADHDVIIQKIALPHNDVYIHDSTLTTSMRNKFHTVDKERRTSIALRVADPFTIADIPNVSSKIYHLAGLLYGDFSSDLIIELSKRGKVGVDMQGFLRHANSITGEMSYVDWDEKRNVFPYIHYLKVDAAEAEVMTGTADRFDAARILWSWGVKEIVITHNTEVLVFDGEKSYTCPIKARNLSGRSGRGDTTFAAYMTERIRADIPESLLWATALVSLKMETPGPFKGTREDVEDYIRQFYVYNHLRENVKEPF